MTCWMILETVAFEGLLRFGPDMKVSSYENKKARSQSVNSVNSVLHNVTRFYPNQSIFSQFSDGLHYFYALKLKGEIPVRVVVKIGMPPKRSGHWAF